MSNFPINDRDPDGSPGTSPPEILSPDPKERRVTAPRKQPAAGQPKKRPFMTRRKKGATCVRCRQQKAKCDGYLPCAPCVTHAEEGTCAYTGSYVPLRHEPGGAASASAPPSASAGDAGPSGDQLISRAELDRLKEHIAQLEVFILGPSPFALAHSLRDPKIVQVALHLEVDNIAGAFGRMLHEDDWGEYCREGERDALVKLGRRLLLTPHQPGSLEWNPAPKIDNPVDIPPEGRAEFVRSILPTPSQAAVLVKVYLARFNWLLFPLQPQAFALQCKAYLGKPPEQLPWDWIALFLAVCRTGLGALNTALPNVDPLLADPQSRHELGDLWLRAALFSLDLADADANPTLDGLRALNILIFAFMVIGESSSAAGMRNLLAQHRRATQMAFMLKLNVDPCNIPASLPDHEKADRRSLWWCLKAVGAMLGNASGIFSSIIADMVADVALPAEPPLMQPNRPGTAPRACPCGKICPPWDPRRGLRSRYRLGGQLIGPLTTLPFRRNPPATYLEVMDMHRKMMVNLEEVPPGLRLKLNDHRIDLASLAKCGLDVQMQISFHLHFYYILLRLHRPVHTLVDVSSANVPFHRTLTLHCARVLLDIRRVARIGPDQTLSGTYFIAAGISLAIDLVSGGVRQRTREASEFKAEIEELLDQFLRPASAPVLQRGRKVIEFLLSRVEAVEQFGTAAEVDSADAEAWLQGSTLDT